MPSDKGLEFRNNSCKQLAIASPLQLRDLQFPAAPIVRAPPAGPTAGAATATEGRIRPSRPIAANQGKTINANHQGLFSRENRARLGASISNILSCQASTTPPHSILGLDKPAVKIAKRGAIFKGEEIIRVSPLRLHDAEVDY